MRDALSFETKSGPAWLIPVEVWRRLCDLYGIGFVVVECAKADLWLLANPTRLKTHRGMPRFLNGWMAKAAKEQAKRPQQVFVDKDWSDVPPEQLEAMRAKYEARGKG
jgi:hypothetical protein